MKGRSTRTNWSTMLKLLLLFPRTHWGAMLTWKMLRGVARIERDAGGNHARSRRVRCRQTTASNCRMRGCKPLRASKTTCAHSMKTQRSQRKPYLQMTMPATRGVPINPRCFRKGSASDGMSALDVGQAHGSWQDTLAGLNTEQFCFLNIGMIESRPSVERFLSQAADHRMLLQIKHLPYFACRPLYFVMITTSSWKQGLGGIPRKVSSEGHCS